MAIPGDAKQTPIPALVRLDAGGAGGASATGTIVDLQQKAALDQMRGYVNGAGRIFACSATGTNVITLTPNGHGDEDGTSPTLEGYCFGDAFVFWAENNSTGAVTATVVPKTGTLATIKAYKTNGAAQAGSGDVVANSLYVAWFNPMLDSGNGGLVLK